MKRLLPLCALTGLLMTGCYGGPAQEAAPSNASTSKAGPGVSMSSTAEAPATAAAQPLGDSGGPVELEAITLTAPAGWKQMQPSSSFVQAEFALPHAQGDDADGRLTVSTAGGTVKANVDRWKGQFDSQARQNPQDEIDVSGLKVTLVDLSGKFNDQRGPFAPAVERPGYRMIAAIIPVNGQLHFIKATGPEKTIAVHADEIRQFVRSVKLSP